MLSVISRGCVWEIDVWVLPALLQRLKGWGGGVSLSVLRHWAATDFSGTRHQVHWMFLFHSISVNECDKLQLHLILGDSLFPGSGGRFQGISECPRFVLNFWTIVVFVPFDILPRMLARSLSVLWIGSVTVCSEFPLPFYTLLQACLKQLHHNFGADPGYCVYTHMPLAVQTLGAHPKLRFLVSTETRLSVSSPSLIKNPSPLLLLTSALLLYNSEPCKKKCSLTPST